MRLSRYYRTRNNKRIKRIQRGGTLTCSLKDLAPKCGNEGCVYFTEDTATKMLIGPDQRVEFLFKRYEEQQKAAKLGIAPQPLEITINPCRKLMIKGKDAPCFVKRGLTARGKKYISYVMQKKSSWCHGYTKTNGRKFSGYNIVDEPVCNIPENLFNVMLKEYGHYKLMIENPEPNIPFPNVNEISNNSNNNMNNMNNNTTTINKKVLTTSSSQFSKLENKTVHPTFVNLFNLYVISIRSERIKGITILDLYKYIKSKHNHAMLTTIKPLWDKEIKSIQSIIASMGIELADIHEDNIMIDVNNENICQFIMDHIKQNIPITPDLLRHAYGYEANAGAATASKRMHILKVVDWGL